MFQDLPVWLIVIVAIVAFLLLLKLFHSIYEFLEAAFKPFKKGKKYWCKVIAVSDGDTITCKRYNLRKSVTKIRLAYVDAPESTQEFGKDAQKIVMSMLYKKLVRIRIVDTDRYGRHVAEVRRRGKNINEDLVKRGAAWAYPDYIKDKQYAARLQKMQAEAKKDKRGLWKNPRAINPSQYRKS